MAEPNSTLACFKAYDIRGRVPQDLDVPLARAIGRAYAREIGPGQVVVGYDVRLESPVLAKAVMDGLAQEGVDVIDIGLCGTEEVYFQSFHRESQGVGGGIMVTASHNPKGYCGMKLVRQGARPISGDSGLNAIRDLAARLLAGDDAGKPARTGTIRQDFDKTAYIDHLLGYVDLSTLIPLKIVANPGNGAAGPAMHLLASRLPFSMVMIQDQPDGNFPNGVPNPLLPEMRHATAQAVIDHGADFGIAWDGDFDRCFLFDSRGRFIEGYYLVGLIAEMLLARHPGGKIIHDPRLTWNTIDQVQAAGGIPVQSKTGHAFIKERMRQEDAVYGGEMSAHHYFRDFAYCDSGMIPWLLIAQLMGRSKKGLAELVDQRIAAFPCSGEINYRVESVADAIALVSERYLPQAETVDRTDGISLGFGNWRFNLRGSNTEPLLRLNVESKESMDIVLSLVKDIENIIPGHRE